MVRADLRTVANITGTVYDALNTTQLYAEDHNTIKEAIDDAVTGVNTQQLEVSGVLIVSSTGAIQNGTGVTSHKDKKLGSNCSGTDGTAGRVLTLTNTKITQNVIVMVSGAFLVEDQDYTVSHIATSSTITFNNAVWNDQYIEVLYFS